MYSDASLGLDISVLILLCSGVYMCSVVGKVTFYLEKIVCVFVCVFLF